MNKTIFILLFFSAIVNSISAQNFSPEEIEEIDSLNVIINNKSNHDTLLASAYIDLSQILYVIDIDTLASLSKQYTVRIDLVRQGVSCLHTLVVPHPSWLSYSTHR